MRTEYWLLLTINGTILLYALTQVYDLITLLYDDTFIDGLIESDLKPVQYRDVQTSSGTVVREPDRKLIVPKIIHQTYKTEEVPEMWLHTQASCRVHNPDYQYMLWTDATSREFIQENYSWFLPTFDSYKYSIQRADVIRYFILSHFGGVYIDLDLGCERNLDAFLAFPAVLRKTEPTGVSNDMMISVPKHPFFLYVISRLEAFNRHWLISYVTIMYSTGPLMLSVLWKRYKRWGVPSGGEVRIYLPANSAHHTTSIFKDVRGSSWHQADAQIIIRMEDHWIFVTLLGTLLGLSIIYLEFRLCQILARRGVRQTFRYFSNAIRSKLGSDPRHRSRSLLPKAERDFPE